MIRQQKFIKNSFMQSFEHKINMKACMKATLIPFFFLGFKFSHFSSHIKGLALFFLGKAYLSHSTLQPTGCLILSSKFVTKWLCFNIIFFFIQVLTENIHKLLRLIDLVIWWVLVRKKKKLTQKYQIDSFWRRRGQK